MTGVADMTSRSSRQTLVSLLGSLRVLVSVAREGRRALRALGVSTKPSRVDGASVPPSNPETADLLRRADDAGRAKRRDEAAVLYREVLHRDRHDVRALRALRDLSVERRQWTEALGFEQRLAAAAPSTERAGEWQWLAIIHYELGRSHLAAGRPAAAIVAFRNAVRADRGFVPATLALGAALERVGDTREAVRVWERGAELEPSLPLLARLEQVSRQDGRPTRMIALYRAAIERAPDNLALAVALGRVFFELEMLDEAVDQFE